MISNTNQFGRSLRFWRQTLNISQEDLSLSINVSRKHLSFLETGKSSPSAELVIRIAKALKLHNRNARKLLTAAGYATVAREMTFDDPDDLWRQQAIITMLQGQDPNPCCVWDRYGSIKAVNRGWVAHHSRWLGELAFEAPLNVYKLFYGDQGWLSLMETGDDHSAWQDILELEQELIQAPNEAVEALYQAIVNRSAIKKALAKNKQQIPPRNFYRAILQSNDLPLETYTVISTTFTADQIMEERLTIDTWYPHDFSLPYTRDDLLMDKSMGHPLLYY